MGVLHFALPRPFEAIVPTWLPRRRALVYLSGAAELGCAAGLAADTSWAGPLAAATLLAVWPANIDMAVAATRTGRSRTRQAALWARVPLQLPMIKAALGARRTAA
jgi:uncharacterized membrane protein